MNAKALILTLSLTLAASAAVAAIKHSYFETAKAVPAVEATVAPIPRVVVTASRDQAQSSDAPVARVVVTARRI